MIIMLLAEGFEEIEALATLDILRRNGKEVFTVSVNSSTVVGAHGISVIADLSKDELDLSRATHLILPGGMPGVTNLNGSEFVHSAINEVLARGGKIGAICAAPLILGRLGLLNGREATCFPGFEEELKGAVLSPLGVVTDGNITTAKSYKESFEFAERLSVEFT